MRPRVFAFLSLLSLTLCIVAVAFWVRSYWGTDYLNLSSPAKGDPFSITHHSHGVAWTRGDIRLSYAEHTLYLRSAVPSGLDGAGPSTWSWGRLGAGHIGSESLPSDTILSRLGFHVYRGGFTSSFADMSEQGVAVPAWLAVAVFGVLPCMWFSRYLRRRRRVVKGLCRICGYDLCATPGRCPECGTDALPAKTGNVTHGL